MKLKLSSYLYIIFIVALYAINYFFMKINVFPFTGIVLGILIALIIAINVYVTLKNKKERLNSDDFIFSPKVADNLKKVDMGIQYETSIISVFFLIVGLLLFCIYTIFFTPYALIMKIFITFNSFFAMLMMGSMLITNYQQYISYRESKKMFAQFSNSDIGIGSSEVLSPESMNESLFNNDFNVINTENDNKVKDWTKNESMLDLTNDKNLIDKIFKNDNNDNERRNN